MSESFLFCLDFFADEGKGDYANYELWTQAELYLFISWLLCNKNPVCGIGYAK